MGKIAMGKWHFCKNSCVVNLSKLKKTQKTKRKQGLICKWEERCKKWMGKHKRYINRFFVRQKKSKIKSGEQNIFLKNLMSLKKIWLELHVQPVWKS